MSMIHDTSKASSPQSQEERWYAVTETRVELYELFVDQVDEGSLSPHVVKASSLLAQGDAALLAQFIKKNGTHFVRSSMYGGMKGISHSLFFLCAHPHPRASYNEN